MSLKSEQKHAPYLPVFISIALVVGRECIRVGLAPVGFCEDFHTWCIRAALCVIVPSSLRAITIKRPNFLSVKPVTSLLPPIEWPPFGSEYDSEFHLLNATERVFVCCCFDYGCHFSMGHSYLPFWTVSFKLSCIGLRSSKGYYKWPSGVGGGVCGKGHLGEFLRGSMCGERMSCWKRWVIWVLWGTGTASGWPEVSWRISPRMRRLTQPAVCSKMGQPEWWK